MVLAKFYDAKTTMKAAANCISLKFVNRVVGNPIHAYKMMKRFAIDWKRIEKSLEDDDWEGE